MDFKPKDITINYYNNDDDYYTIMVSIIIVVVIIVLLILYGKSEMRLGESFNDGLQKQSSRSLGARVWSGYQQRGDSIPTPIKGAQPLERDAPLSSTATSKYIDHEFGRY